MDIQIKPLARQSRISGERFEPGERVQCILFRNGDGELDRMDVRVAEAGELEPGGAVLCRWERTVKKKTEERIQGQLENAEAMFGALVEELDTEEEGGAEANNTEGVQRRGNSVLLVNLLAVMLERKRILKLVRQEPCEYVYRNMRTKEEVRITRRELAVEEIVALEAELDALLRL